MMGEFILYYKGKIVGGYHDDRLLVKPVKSAISYIPNAEYELPYEGAKEMLLVADVDNTDYLTGLFYALPELDHWTDKQETKAEIDNLIRDTLRADLPECYDEVSISSYRQQIYEYVYTRCGAVV